MGRIAWRTLRSALRGPAPRIGFLYLAFGILWITASDWVLAALVSDVEMLSTIQTYKGWAFVIVTAVLVYLLVWGYFRRLLRLQDRLQQREEAFRDYVQLLPVGAFRSRPGNGGKLVMANNRIAEMFGFDSPDALTQANPYELSVNRADVEALTEEVRRQGGVTNRPVELRRRDGSRFWGSVTARAILSETGDEYIDGILVDITARKTSEEELQRLWMAVEHAAESIMICDPDARILYTNPAFESVSGYSREEALGRNCSLLNSGKHDRRFYEAFWDTITAGHVWRGRFINRRKDGTLNEEEATVSPVRNARGDITHYVSVKRDVTHEARLERELRQAQKMEAVGRMAGGIAHDFNNILSAIIGFADLALTDVEPGTRARDDIREVLTAAERARDIVQRILTFSRQAQPEPKPVQPARVVEEAMVLIRSFVPSTIQIETSIDRTCGLVLAEPTQLHQVVMNLVTNACHAMAREGGVLTLSVGDSSDPARPGHAKDQPMPQRCVCITVADTGHGMDAETQQYIFDPYFTTKGMGEGTGLGLATVHAIVQTFEGVIEVDSTLGEGTEFRVYLPVTEATEADDTQLLTPVPSGGGRRLLLVDDEPAVLKSTQRQLERSGFEVVAAGTPREAIEALSKAPETYSAVITDQTMPGTSGVELARQCRQVRSEIPIMLITGHGTEAMHREAQSAGVSRIIGKPVSREDLVRAIQEVLAAPE